MRRYLITTALMSLPFLLVIFVVNYFIADPASLAQEGYEEAIAEAMLAGHYVTEFSDHDERLVLKHWVPYLKYQPDILVFGSSRTKTINSTIAKGKTLFNSSASGASLQDMVAMYQLHHEAGHQPRQVIIGVDPWMLNENRGDTRWHTIRDAYLRFDPNAPQGRGIATPTLKIWLNYFSLSYFQESMKDIMEGGIPTPGHFVVTDQQKNPQSTRQQDGSNLHPDHGPIPEAELDLSARTYAAGTIYGLNDFFTLSEDYQNLFVRWVQTMKARGAQVSFLLLPYHPIVYEVAHESYPMVDATEAWVRQLAQQEGFTVYGSYDPAQLGLEKAAFTDGMHILPPRVLEIASHLIE